MTPEYEFHLLSFFRADWGWRLALCELINFRDRPDWCAVTFLWHNRTSKLPGLTVEWFQ